MFSTDYDRNDVANSTLVELLKFKKLSDMSYDNIAKIKAIQGLDEVMTDELIKLGEKIGRDYRPHWLKMMLEAESKSAAGVNQLAGMDINYTYIFFLV